MKVSRYPIIERVLNRTRKLVFLIVLIPILTGAISYFIETKKETSQSSYTEITLGEFSYPYLTDPAIVRELFKSKHYLSSLNEKYNLGLNVKEVLLNIQVSNKPYNTLILTLRGAENDKILSSIVDSFLKESNDKYNSQKNLINEKLERLSTTTSPETIVDKERFSYELSTKLGTFRETVINEPIIAKEAPKNPKQRAIIGLIAGLMLSFSILLLPEFFRK